MDREKTLIKDAIDQNGMLQLLKTAEECNELSKAINKYMFEPTERHEERIVEEAGDVMLTLQYVGYLLGDFNLKKAKEIAIDNLEKRLKDVNTERGVLFNEQNNNNR